ncbi:UDP-glycosyltransferase 89B2-like [Curcuma longa]|uniref:UDP-glycosyltransferase 89B2-like n=1 Tax=Curcuma longa TaxID=136217 RepID=UPI003D9EFFB4
MVGKNRQRQPHVLVIPYPAPGHMLCLLDLAHLLSARFGLAVTVAVTPANLPILSSILARSPSVSPLVLPFPEYPSLPPGVENAKDIDFPQFLFFIHALAGLRGPLLDWARAGPDPPDAIISDLFLGWTNSLAAELGIPRIVFTPSGALSVSIFHWLWRRMPQRSNLDDPDELISFPSLPNSPLFRWRDLSGLWKIYRRGDPVCEFFKEGMLANIQSWGLVINTFSELEHPYLDYLRDVDLGHRRVWAVGPLLPPLDAAAERGGTSSVAGEKVAAWLDGCDEGSVVYVALGSHTLLAPPQAAALAAGMERSGARFLWAVKEGTVLPEGFEERAAGQGLVVHGWAPQVVILGHPAVGLFLTHCGWNSVMEATAAGVALLMWPMMADHFVGARVAEEVAGVGLRVCDDGPGAVPDPDELARVVAEAQGEGGRERRERAKAMAARSREATEEGGSSYKNVAELVEELRKLVATAKPSKT